MKSIRIALCQMNPTVGDLEGNSRKILEGYWKAAQRFKTDLVVFPELSLCGYSPEDLVLRKSFVDQNRKFMNRLAQKMTGPACIVGYVRRKNGKTLNSAAVIQNARISSNYSKKILPNYGVFDEKRIFAPGEDSGIFRIKGIPIGLNICEDLWEEDLKLSPCAHEVKKGAKILINISASPYHAGKMNERLKILQRRARQTHCPIVYVNMVGGQDELVFDGRSMVVDQKGTLILLAQSFKEDVQVVSFELQGRSGVSVTESRKREPLLTGAGEIYQALVLGTKDYVEKNKFKGILIGLSGGIDSALTACIAVDAIGKHRVTGVTMPSKFSSRGTRRDAEKIAKNLGIHLQTIPIGQLMDAFTRALSLSFKGTKPNIAEENIQSRIRGTLLMALSNKFGHLVLTTGNKSETSVGYCTLYGDTAGGFAVLKDVPKTVVYQLALYVNQRTKKTIVPGSTIRRAPTAELKVNQKDQDTLPPYVLLDQIIKGYVEEDLDLETLRKRRFNKVVLTRVIKMIDQSEYKRRQSPPGVKITPKSFGRDRRMPITNLFSET